MQELKKKRRKRPKNELDRGEQKEQKNLTDITEEQLIKLFRNKPDSELMSSNSSLIKFIKAFAYYNYPRYIQWLHNKCKQNEITQLFSQLNKQEKET